MAVFMAGLISNGKYDYTYVVTKRPDLKEGIDTELARLGKSNLIV